MEVANKVIHEGKIWFVDNTSEETLVIKNGQIYAED